MHFYQDQVRGLLSAFIFTGALSGCMANSTDLSELDQSLPVATANVSEADEIRTGNAKAALESDCPGAARYCFWEFPDYHGRMIALYGRFDVPDASMLGQAVASMKKRMGTGRVEIWSEPDFEGNCALFKNGALKVRQLAFPPESIRTIPDGRRACKPGPIGE